MTDPFPPPRPVPRWLHVWAVVAVCATLALLVLGQMVTSFRAGMADPVWPTEPWYLLNNYRLDFGYLIEHAHRILGFTVGALVGVLAVGLWAAHPRRADGLACAAALVVLLGAFGEFHRALLAQRDPGVPVVVPVAPVAVMLLILAGLALVAGHGVAAGTRGGVARAAGLAALVFVMVQGLLGGFRVKLNELVGTDLAAVHGVFGQVTFAVLVAVAVLTARPPADHPDGAPPARVRRSAAALVGLLFVQLTLGAWVRHAPDSLGQRLHILVAFLVAGKVVSLLRTLLATPAAWDRARPWGWALGLLVALQVTLGVEAWMGKFGEESRRGLPAGVVVAELQPVSVKQAALRTAHALVGTGVLATAVGLALAVRARRPADADAGEPITDLVAAGDAR